MKKKILLLIISVIAIGCTEQIYVMGPTITKTITKTDTIIVNAGMQLVTLNVDWIKLASTSNINDDMVYALSDSALEITHVGSRLVYANNNASFTQSVVKGTGSISLITMQVPPTDTAHLYVVAVYEKNGVRKALKMGVKRNIRISATSPVNLTLDSLTMIDTEWFVSDTSLVIRNDTIINKDSITSTNNIVNIKIVDPYQINETTSHSNTIVKFYGSGFGYGNTDGWRRYGIAIQNKSVAVTIDKFWPYIDGSLFNLNGEYLIGKQGIIKTTWQ